MNLYRYGRESQSDALWWTIHLEWSRRAMYVYRNMKARSRNNCCCGKQINITNSEFVSVASVIQPCSTHASYYMVDWFVRLHRIFLQYLINGTTFEKRLLNIHVRCVFRVSIQLLSETFPVLRRTEWDIINNVYWSLQFINQRMHIQFHIQHF